MIRKSILLFLAAILPAQSKHPEFTAEERGWWSFQPVKKVAPPAVDESRARIAGEVDRFVVAKLHAVGLEQAPEAETRELLRRIHYNLHGLPPDEARIAAYLKDPRPDKWERLIDELLASPRYGVRWSQHWLDLVRYAESDGYREDAYRPHAWPYRDYVIRSFNEDKPYDRFVREQLAGDEINPEDPETLIGTAFLRHGIYEWNQADAEMQRDLIVKELTGLTGEVFLGMSVGCAECHDHKFDPILQEDYYRFRAFFEPLQWRDDLPLANADEKRAYAAAMAAWEAEATEALAAWEAEKQRATAKGAAKALAYFPPAVQEMKHKPLDQLTPHEKQVLYLVDRRIAVEVGRAVDPLKAKSAAWAAYKPFEDRKPKPLQPAFVATDVGAESPATVMTTRRGKANIAPGFLTILAPDDLEIEPLKHLDSTGRRSALANWITDPANPLSTRVIVNRVWQHHFGRGLSGVASDFGRLGEAPSHPELLDWLTAGFIENGWSIQWLHRQILNSATYRQSSLVKSTPRSDEVDPGNRLLWRFRPLRLDGEQLRDTLLTLSGEWKPKTGGPAEEGSKPVPSAFVRKQRNSPDEFLSRFDAPPGFHSVAQRDATNTALQSLLMSNADWPMQRARSMAARLLAADPHADPAALSASAIQLTFGRPARDKEREDAAAFLGDQQDRIERDRPKHQEMESSSPLVDGGEWFPGIASAGEPSLVFRPGSEHETIRITTAAPEDLAFSIEAIVWLDSLQSDASVRTIASRWDGNQAVRGWSFGVTGMKSRFSPGQLIMPLNANAMASAGSGPFEWIKPPRIPAANPAKLEALADLFHILINSNEFLYLP
jgi:hypothetical protein